MKQCHNPILHRPFSCRRQVHRRETSCLPATDLGCPEKNVGRGHLGGSRASGAQNTGVLSAHYAHDTHALDTAYAMLHDNAHRVPHTIPRGKRNRCTLSVITLHSILNDKTLVPTIWCVCRVATTHLLIPPDDCRRSERLCRLY